ncbi:MAG TPA: hypothetical protein VK956_17195, partial [Verrucomicrobium sp.]|nr:hypothetical protein [Verrucomicrobium sp.]
MKKKVLIAGLGFIVILAGVGVGGYQWLLGRFDKASVVSQMEAAWNCRAQIDATDIQMLASPARLQIKGLQLAPKDDQIGLPLAQRQPLAAGKALLATESAVLEVELKDLINGTVNVKELHISGVSMRTEVDEEGRSSLQTLFKSPEAAPTPPDASAQAVQAQVSETKATGVNVTEVK